MRATRLMRSPSITPSLPGFGGRRRRKTSVEPRDHPLRPSDAFLARFVPRLVSHQEIWIGTRSGQTQKTLISTYRPTGVVGVGDRCLADARAATPLMAGCLEQRIWSDRDRAGREYSSASSSLRCVYSSRDGAPSPLHESVATSALQWNWRPKVLVAAMGLHWATRQDLLLRMPFLASVREAHITPSGPVCSKHCGGGIRFNSHIGATGRRHRNPSTFRMNRPQRDQ